MKPKTQPTFKEVFAQLESLGSEAYRKIYAQNGAGWNQFGVGFGKLRALAKKLKRNHPLALELWATGNSDAMLLAVMIMDPAQITAKQLDTMVKAPTYHRLVDEWVDNVVVETPFAEEMRAKWMDSKSEFIGRAGWQLQGIQVRQKAAELDLDALLKRIEKEIKAAPMRKQESMNTCLVMIALNSPAHTQKCIALGEKLGKLDDRPVPKGCTSSYAPEWIAVALKKKK